MKPWIKWTAIGLVIAILAGGTVRTLSARKDKAAALEAQQTAQQTQVSIDLVSSDMMTATQRELPLNVAISGTVSAVDTATIKAKVAGELQGLKVREGDPVRAGQVLGQIDPTEPDARLRQARQQAQAAKAQVDIAQRTHDNNQALVAQGFISSTALNVSQANLAAALATYAAAQSAADVSAKTVNDAVLRSPIDGFVSQRLAQSGERLGIDAHVLEVVNLNRLEMQAELTVGDAQQVKVGQTAQLRIQGLAEPVAARVARINPSASVGSRAVVIYLAIAPGSALRHGLFAEGLLATGTVTTLAVPLSAVRTDKPKPYVQVVQGDVVQHVTVALGARSEVDGQTLVGVTGLAPGATVLAGTVGVLREGTRVKVAAAAQGAV
ncbi:efflux RND transporter periplasmic adaptor subunit [Rhodoferax sp. U2-2l]|uniref:efflux RND transporter periplasmic adaptor subunit n=1 Tax=Rhodoferax sp. U2-2l TaxID=2884000 RepID=UPI001D0AAD16|nr:efflux RND transporter periplasmic adaptor subunit [Rhodoferax sp. U2-2l]MCB8748571.1 efflux RND transporter periplasmic adaptor subunit [Rhodoferax sp. U2-2l]